MTHKVQVDDTVKDATADEVARIDAQRADLEARAAALEAKEAAAESARAKLKKLGLTDDEIAALVGG